MFAGWGFSASRHATSIRHVVNYPTLHKKRRLVPRHALQSVPGHPLHFWPLGGCRWSRRCTRFGSADGRVVVEATMRPGEVVVGGPGLEVLVALFGVFPVSGIGPLAQCGLDKAFGLAIGTGS